MKRGPLGSGGVGEDRQCAGEHLVDIVCGSQPAANLGQGIEGADRAGRRGSGSRPHRGGAQAGRQEGAQTRRQDGDQEQCADFSAAEGHGLACTLVGIAAPGVEPPPRAGLQGVRRGLRPPPRPPPKGTVGAVDRACGHRGPAPPPRCGRRGSCP